MRIQTLLFLQKPGHAIAFYHIIFIRGIGTFSRKRAPFDQAKPLRRSSVGLLKFIMKEKMRLYKTFCLF